LAHFVVLDQGGLAAEIARFFCARLKPSHFRIGNCPKEMQSNSRALGGIRRRMPDAGRRQFACHIPIAQRTMKKKIDVVNHTFLRHTSNIISSQAAIAGQKQGNDNAETLQA
jgi:hypothetical protein